ncbi:MAG: gliding motility lipoprotein GldH [Bacteroidales bacterium]|jgi:gliding motility-associated lipoprotein GldH|nr:gliding motility lipoprotein GldH [Bacteroidales bacterium]
MKRRFIFLFFAFIFLLSCNDNVLFDKNESIPNDTWAMSRKLSFEVNVKDTLTNYDFAINFRHTTKYPYSNALFFITTFYPDNSVTQKDTIECIVADSNGVWTGKGSGNLKDNRFRFARSVRFPRSGRYTFEIEQATRDTNLAGVSDVGLHIESVRTK